jgi:hypothetical protein
MWLQIFEAKLVVLSRGIIHSAWISPNIRGCFEINGSSDLKVYDFIHGLRGQWEEELV